MEFAFQPGEPRRWLEEAVLPGYVARCRWFGGKARDPQRFEVADLLRLPGAPELSRLALVRIHFRDGSADFYQLPLAIISGRTAEQTAAEAPSAVLTAWPDGALCDGLYDADFRDSLVRLLRAGATVRGETGELCGTPGDALESLLGSGTELPTSRVLRVEQSNSSMVCGDSLFVKIIRRLEEGINPDAEILRFLTEKQSFAHSPAFGGMLEYRARGRPAHLLALASSVVVSDGDAWAFTLRELSGFLKRAEAIETEPLPSFSEHAGDSLLRETIGPAFLARAAQLGRRTGEMHVALASDTSDPDFAPEPLTASDLRELQETTAASLKEMFGLLKASATAVQPDSPVGRLIRAERTLTSRAAMLSTQAITTAKTRHHGDCHLGQVLETGSDFVIIDFEGEPARSLAERRRKRSPLRDVAGMLRSFHYAAHCALRAHPSNHPALTPWAEQWSRLIGAVFLDAWSSATAGAPFVPRDPAQQQRLLDAFLLEKAVYEVGYELNNRPDWVDIPVRGLLSLAQR